MPKNPFIVPFTNRRYLDALADHVVLFDGAMGTELAPFLKSQGLAEMLLLEHPRRVEEAHLAYLNAGAEVVETNSFRANRVTLEEYGVADRLKEINWTAANVARRMADHVQATTGVPRFVAGSMGPTGKLPSLDDPEFSDVAFDELAEIYAEQARALISGKVDLLLLETHQDLLELKAAIYGIWKVFRRENVRIPIQVQVTLDATGHMLTGPDVEAAVVTLAALPVDVVGLNCSTGPEEMRDAVRRTLAISNRPVSILPNAGMPQNVDGRAVYEMKPEPFAETLVEFAAWGVRAVGGCCGTTPAHIAHLNKMLRVEALGRVEAAPDLTIGYPPGPLPYLASATQAVALHQEPRPLLVGERINAQGSRKARNLILEERYDALVELAETQVNYGAHVLDICLALTERADEDERMRRVAKLLSLNTPAPLMIDTTDPEVMRAALESVPGRAIVNSINLEGGEKPALDVMELARDFGAALVVLTIDQHGMAKTAERKLQIAHRLHSLAVKQVGLASNALIFDPLTFTLATGDPASANAAVETLEAIRRIKEELPGVLTNLGVSNVSYGLKPPARRVLNSVFLYRAVEAGLDLAIVNPAQITPYADVPELERELADDLILNRRPDALSRFVEHFEKVVDQPKAGEAEDTRSPAERLRDAVVFRRREGVEVLVDGCLETHTPLAVLNEVLLPAMQVVGERFGTGELILPFVLKSAEVMKAAVAHLEPYMDRAESVSKGTVVLATVFGDVHDIGKNLVKAILVNNGYTVHDLGKQVPVTTIVDRAEEVEADAIGLSALLVATSQQMRLAVAELRRRGLTIPVLIGGAAVNAVFAERIALDAKGRLYGGGVFYCKDAFDALRVLSDLVEVVAPEEAAPSPEGLPEAAPPALTACPSCLALPAPGAGDAAYGAPLPPFWGAQLVSGIPMDELLPLVDRKRLFRVGWGARGLTGERWEELAATFNERLEAMWLQAESYLSPRALYGYFPVHASGNDLVVYDPAQPEARREIARFTFPRQPGEGGLCLADYFAPVTSGEVDVAAFQVVTVGSGATKRFTLLEEGDEYEQAYFVHGLAAHTTEAVAEWVHRRIRAELNLSEDQGKRYSWGYPACPDVGAHRELFRLLTLALGDDVEVVFDVSLTPSAQLVPEHSTAALVVHHPEARHFAVRK